MTPNRCHTPILSLILALFCATAIAESAPNVVSTEPAIGVTDVDPSRTEIRVVFDQEMAGGFSWTGGGDAFPEVREKPYWEADKKTCVLPVTLAPGKFYRVGINSSGARNFKSESGLPAQFSVIYFTTAGADPATLQKLAVPQVTSMNPGNGATGVDASTTELVVTFDQPMAPGFSWTKTDGVQPQSTAKPWWNEDQTVCTLPVTLEPNTTYSIGLNHAFANNFQSAHGVPLERVVWTFSTAE